MQGAKKMAYQFIHYETYNATEATRIIGEGLRYPENSPHVHKPLPPELLYGAVDGLAEEIVNRAKSKKVTVTQLTRSKVLKTFERPLREKEHVFLAGVVSYPREWSEQNPRLFEQAKKKSIDELKRRYGSQLKAAIFHDDEEHPHLHFWVIPDDLNLSNVCPAIAAEKAVDVSKSKATAKHRKAVRFDALRTYQDEWAEVMGQCGLARYGPKRRRLSSHEWKAEQAQLHAVAVNNVAMQDMKINLAGASAAMLSQSRKHQSDIAAMDAKASSMLQGMTAAQQIEVAKQIKVAEVVNDLLGI
jgi:hypothetical protein